MFMYPDSGFAWQLLGGSLQMQGTGALHAFQKTAELLPDDARAHYNLGTAFICATTFFPGSQVYFLQFFQDQQDGPTQ